MGEELQRSITSGASASVECCARFDDLWPGCPVHCGNLDLLAADVVRLRGRALANAAPDFTFILRNGPIHDWALGGPLSTPESAVVQRDIYRQLGLET